jgi:hypothetical protein
MTPAATLRPVAILLVEENPGDARHCPGPEAGQRADAV